MAMFNHNELAIIWFALLMEQTHQEEDSDHWWRYERMILKIEEEVGATKRHHLKIVKDE